MKLTYIQYFGNRLIAVCDGNCEKAWGINTRPKVMLSDNPDDYEFLADGELGIAPKDPETYEGCNGKPLSNKEPHNRWCVRECERCSLVHPAASGVKCKNFDIRRKNIKETEK